MCEYKSLPYLWLATKTMRNIISKEMTMFIFRLLSLKSYVYI